MSSIRTKFELCGGPRDGASVQQCGMIMPNIIYLRCCTARSSSERAVWSVYKSNSFPHRYIYNEIFKAFEFDDGTLS